MVCQLLKESLVRDALLHGVCYLHRNAMQYAATICTASAIFPQRTIMISNVLLRFKTFHNQSQCVTTFHSISVLLVLTNIANHAGAFWCILETLWKACGSLCNMAVHCKNISKGSWTIVECGPLLTIAVHCGASSTPYCGAGA